MFIIPNASEDIITLYIVFSQYKKPIYSKIGTINK